MAQLGHPIIGGQRIDQRRAQGLVIGIGYGADGSEIIGQTRAVGHQVIDGDVARAVIEVVQRAGGGFQHLEIGELRCPFGDRVVQLKLAFLHQH